MRQGKTPTRDFVREFERRARDAEMSAETSKVHLVAALNEETLQNLDAYVTLQGGEAMARLETMPDRLRRIGYAQMLSYLKQGNLTDLAKQGAGHTAPDDKRRGSTNPVGFGFIDAGIMTVATRGKATRRSSHRRRRRTTSAQVVAAARGRGRNGGSAYKLVSVPSRSEHLKAYVTSLAHAHHLLPAELCHDPLPVLAAVTAVLDQSAANDHAAPADRQKAADAMCYLAERLAALTSLVDPSAPSVNSAFTADVLPRGESGRRRGPSRTLLFDVARGLARRVPLTKLVELDGDVRPYLAALMVAALMRAHETLVVPDTLQLRRVSLEAFENMLQAEAGKAYDNYGTISRSLLGAAAESTPAEIEARHRARLEGRLDHVVDLVQRMTEMIGGTGDDSGSVNMDDAVK